MVANTLTPPVPTKRRAGQVGALFLSIDKDPLPDTTKKMRHIPESLRPLVSEISGKLMARYFKEQAAAAMEREGWGVDRSLKPTIIAHSAKLFVLGDVSSLAMQPWHLADEKILKLIHNEMRQSGDMDCARKHLMATKPINLFIASTPEDDRDSYLKAVASLVRTRKVHQLVLDAELIGWLPDADFLQACDITGLNPHHVGITERANARSHDFFQPNKANEDVATMFLTTQGRAMLEGAAAVGSAANNDPQATGGAARVDAKTPIDTPPSNQMMEKIHALRARQSLRMRH